MAILTTIKLDKCALNYNHNNWVKRPTYRIENERKWTKNGAMLVSVYGLLKPNTTIVWNENGMKFSSMSSSMQINYFY